MCSLKESTFFFIHKIVGYCSVKILQKGLQYATLDLNNVDCRLNSLLNFVLPLCSEFDDFEEQDKELSETNTYKKDCIYIPWPFPTFWGVADNT